MRSDLAWSLPDRIVVRGKDLPGEILGSLNLGDMAFLELMGREPNSKESKLFNAIAVTLVEHGVTPSALVARSTEGAAKLLAEAVAKGDDASKVAAEHKRIPGLGHPVHKPVDPRAVRLFEIARETGFYGKYCKLMEQIGELKALPVNATGAIGAIGCEMGFDWRILRGIGVMARAIGLVGHILEETRQPLAEEVWRRAEEEASAHLKPKK